MNQMPVARETKTDTSAEIIKIAILAVGGQGGGVLTNWIADLGARGGFGVQMTSVAGVAQRTGATIYYVEMAPKSENGVPVMALSPVPGDVDILIASELMEAGRAVMRGFVTPDKTTLITSSHRILAVDEKQHPADGVSDSKLVRDKIEAAAQNLICFDMEKIATDTGSVISSSLFGGLARSGALPFPISDYEEVIRASGRAVDASLQAFRAVLEHDPNAPVENLTSQDAELRGPEGLVAEWQQMTARLSALPAPVQPIALAGLKKVVDFQDIEYGQEYLNTLDRFSKIDPSMDNHNLSRQAAKYIANAMCYDDIIRVADLKTRASRQTRLRQEQQVPFGSIVHVTEYFHPRAEEFCLTMPAGIGHWLMKRPVWFKTLDRMLNKGRRIRTDRATGFFLLWLIARLRPMRRRLLRHKHEAHHINTLTTLALDTAQTDPALAAEILQCQRLVKGYSDTHARAQSKYARVIGSLDLLRDRKDAADWLRRLRDAALQDEDGIALDGAIATVRSFTATAGRNGKQSN